MLQIEPMYPKHQSEIELLSVNAQQRAFVGTMEEILVNISDWVHPHVVISEQQVIGFFLVDTRYSLNVDFCQPDDIGIRAFFIDSRQQGKGYGKLAVSLLKPYLQRQYPMHHQVYLTVNCRNKIAFHCYEAGGFKDTRALYLGGAAGPQHIMSLHLTSTS
ncbi:GNAT family N-acetyltransferase [Vibrio mangrovi]|uniref:GNAT family protein n=1 Tax=Vibrio mangrovi TaxID=474394 RepID=A0A1Y6IV71_9VIBR|nr:GNAT family protein [Vibrio mangrovi]MDW6001583.1 GNAT family protein [Vibrio mangrovi]SMS00392.1 hypothetical protein VIM7927_01644 [Vibrio mangrovi]